MLPAVFPRALLGSRPGRSGRALPAWFCHRAARTARAFALAGVALCGAACGGAQQAPEHTGWTLRYTARVGSGSAPPREVRPEVAMLVLDGRARITVAGSGLEARLDGAAHRAVLCQGGRCAPAAWDEALAAVTGTTEVRGPAGAVEARPVIEPAGDTEEVANVPTRGARFAGEVRGAGTGTVRVEGAVRWIEEPGERSVAVAQAFFLAPLERIGLARLAAAIRRTAGLPLAWEVRITTVGADGASAQGSVANRAAEIANPPGAL